MPESAPVPSQVANSVFCIPGTWDSFEDFHGKLITATGGAYMVVDTTLINGKDQRQYILEYYDEPEERMLESFRSGGVTTAIDEQTLAAVAGHTGVIYLLGETGNEKEVEIMAEVGLTLLDTGGIGLKVETAGKAFSKAKWQELFSDPEPESRLFNLFVQDFNKIDDDTFCSCGMHNLGFKDVIVSGESHANALSLIRLFSYYQIIDKPVIEEGQTFRFKAESPVYRITTEANPPYAESILYNPFGVWRLTRIDDTI